MTRSIEFIYGVPWIRTTDENGSVGIEPFWSGFRNLTDAEQEAFLIELGRVNDETESKEEANAHTEKLWNRR